MRRIVDRGTFGLGRILRNRRVDRSTGKNPVRIDAAMTERYFEKQNNFDVYSPVMRFFRKIGRDRLAWALRRFHCPVPHEALVLEVGSGGNPYPRADVLVDAYEDTRERHWVPLTTDRPTVLGFAENLPFKDKSFDFVIAAHVLEHSPHPEKFLSELQRVAKAGYIETPDAFMERINPYRDHRLEVTERDGALVITKKTGWRVDEALVRLYEFRAKRHITRETIPGHPFDFHVRHYWRDKIAYTISNPEADATWLPPESEGQAALHHNGGGWRTTAGSIFRTMFSQAHRNGKVDLFAVLRCVSCNSGKLRLVSAECIRCETCRSNYVVKNGIPVFTRTGL